MLPQIRGSVSPKIQPSHAAWFAAYQFYRDAPLIADDWQRALVGTGIRWDALVFYHWIREDFGRKPLPDVFGIGFQGSREDTVVNAAIHVASLSAIDDLPGDERFWQQYARIWGRWERYCDAIIHRETEGTPLPEPVKPTPDPVPPPAPQPVPVPAPQPAPVEPQKPGFDWKRVAGIISSVAAVAATVAALTPTPLDDLIVRVIRMIAQFLGG